ncbi:Cdc16, partial [Symbiodinium microadriaticum]
YLEGHWPDDQGASDPKTASCFALLRGKVYEAMENLENALMWYQRAVQLDSYCHEALDRLVGSQLLTLEQEISLLKGLALHPEDEWLRHLYAAKLSANRGSNENPLEETPCADGQSAAGTPAVLGDWKRARRRSLRRGGVPAEGYLAELLPSALVENGHARAAQSTRFFCQGDYESCFLVSKQVLEDDPYHLAALPVHISSLVMLNMTNVVFYVAHQLMNAYPTAAVAWFTAGCYYYMIRKYELARRFLHKALSLDSAFAPAWIAFGHAFASHDESDQALAAHLCCHPLTEIEVSSLSYQGSSGLIDRQVSAAETELGFGVADGSYIDKDELSVQAEKSLGIGLVGLGAGCLADPVSSSKMYGMPLEASSPALSWVKVAGVRDICLGVGTLALFFFQPSALRVFAPATLVVAASDAALTIGGPFPAPFNHLMGVVGIGILSVAAWFDPTLTTEGEGYKRISG